MSSVIYTPIMTAGIGDFTSQIDQNKINADGDLNSMLRINDTEYLLHCYMDSALDGFVETRQCNSTSGVGQGNFTGVQIDRYEFAPSDGIGAGMCPVRNSDFYLIGYSVGSGSNSKFSTVKVSEAGAITKALQGNATDNHSALYYNLTQLHGNYYVAVAQDYGGDPDPIYLTTLYVNSSNGTLWIVDSHQLIADGKYPKVSRVTDNVVAVTCVGASGFVNVTTWHINDTGNIGRLYIDSQKHNGITNGKIGFLRCSDTNYYLVTYTYESVNLYYPGVGSVTIIPDGNITTDASYGDSYEWARNSGATGYYPQPFTIQNENIYGICDGGFVYIFNSSTGNIDLHGSTNGYESYPGGTRSSYYSDVIRFSEDVFVGCLTTGGEVFEFSFGIENNWAAPAITPYPPNGSVLGDTSTYLSVYVSDDNGDDMNIKWYSNVSGSWKYYQSNSSVSNGTYYLYHSDFNSLSWETEYYWRVDVTDYLNVHNTSELYHFSCKNFTGGGGTNGSDYVDLQPNLTVNVSATLDNITWYWWNNSAWEWFGNNETNFVSGNYSMHFQNATSCCTLYQWAVDLENSITGVSNFSTYWFISMCPSNPTNFAVSRYNGTCHNLTWTKWSNSNATGTVYTMIRYSNTSFPTSPTSGIELYNGTNAYYNHTDLVEGRTYYYSAWTIYHKNNSWCTSGTYTTKSLESKGGDYNITIRWEGDNNKVIVGSDFWKALNITFRQRNGTVITNESISNYGSNPFTISVNETPDVIYITYDSWGVLRSLTPNATERSQTFWFSNRSFWNGSDVDDLSSSQLYYKFEIQDQTRNSIFKTSPETKFYIYRDYNSTVSQDIHQMFLDSERNAWAFLEYGREYYFGIECDDDNRPYIGSFFAEQDQTITVIIYPKNDTEYFISEFVNKTTTALSNKLWINYTDSSFRTNYLMIKIYERDSNGTMTLVNWTAYYNTSSVNRKWFDTEGYDPDKTYVVDINITHDYFDSVIHIRIYTFPYISGKIDKGWFNNVMESVLGECPVTPISWASLVSFIIAFVMLVTFGSYNGTVGLLMSGFAVFGMEIFLWDNSPTRFIAGVTGVTMIVLAIIFSYGSGKR